MICPDCKQPKRGNPCITAFCCAFRSARYRLKSRFQSDYEELFPLICSYCARGVPLVHYQTGEKGDFWMHREAGMAGKERHFSCEGNQLRMVLENVKGSGSTRGAEDRQAVS